MGCELVLSIKPASSFLHSFKAVTYFMEKVNCVRTWDRTTQKFQVQRTIDAHDQGEGTTKAHKWTRE